MYIGNSNLTSRLIKGDLACPFEDGGGVGILDEGGEQGGEDGGIYGGEGGGGGRGLLPSPPLPFGWLEFSPCYLVVLSSYNNYTISNLSYKSFLKAFSSLKISSCTSSYAMISGVCGVCDLLEPIWGFDS